MRKVAVSNDIYGDEFTEKCWEEAVATAAAASVHLNNNSCWCSCAQVCVVCGCGTKKNFNNNFILDKSINAMIVCTRSYLCTHTYIYTYRSVCVCVWGCVCLNEIDNICSTIAIMYECTLYHNRIMNHEQQQKTKLRMRKVFFARICLPKN